MSINTVLAEVSASVTALQSHGIGTRSYSNVEMDYKLFPRSWVFSISTDIQLVQSGALIKKYKVVMDIDDTISFGATSTEIINKLDEISPYVDLFISKLYQRQEVVSLTDVKAEQVIHEFDANVVGFLLSFNIIIQEDITYC
jgi:hypothetical protein